MQELIILLSAHFISDFSLQPKYMIEDKMRDNAFGYLTLIGHCFTHAIAFAVVFLFLNSPIWFELSMFVFVSHFLIDTGKINHKYSVWVDQLLHIGVILICRSLI